MGTLSRFLTIFSLSFALFFNQAECKSKTKSSKYPQLYENPHITSTIRKRIKPHLLDANHPVKPIMDSIFHTTRATQNYQTMVDAGFNFLYIKPRSHIVVVSHPSLNGYLIKGHLDTELRIKRGRENWEWFVKRCEGVERVRNVIKINRMKYFQAPRKWIYPLPRVPSSPVDGNHKQHPVVLLVEDMRLVPYEDNKHAWATMVTKKHLDELYTIIKKAGGSSYRADNIWLSENGKFSFIDTEYSSEQHDYDSISRYLNPEMQQYWNKLTHGKH